MMPGPQPYELYAIHYAHNANARRSGAFAGTAGGPQQPFNGLASAGTLVRYGEDGNNCGSVKLQFDAGRGTMMRLSQLGIGTEQLNAVFFTHMHNDHTEGFADLVQSRWAFHGTGAKLDAVCSCANCFFGSLLASKTLIVALFSLATFCAAASIGAS